MKTLSKFYSETEECNIDKSNILEDLSFKTDPPNLIVLKRKAIRVFPDGRKVALYYADKINQYVTIPYSDTMHGNKSIVQAHEQKQDRRDNTPTLSEGFKVGDKVKIHQDLPKATGEIVGSDDHNYHVVVGPELRRHFVGDPRSNVIHMPKNNIHQLNKYRAGIPRNETVQMHEQKEDRRGNMPALQEIVQTGQPAMLTFDNGGQLKVDVMTAQAIINIFDRVNLTNRIKIERMINKDQNNFAKVAAFAHGAHTDGM